MSRHVARIGHIPLQQFFSGGATATTPPHRVLQTALSTSRHLLAQHLRIPPVTWLASRALSSIRDVAAKDTKAPLLRSPAIVTRRVGLTNAFRVQRCPSLHIELASGRRIRNWQQSRLFSEKRSPEDGLQSTRSSETSSEQNRLAESSKAAEEHAANAAGNKYIADRLPHPHMPTKYELLAAASGFWQRFRIHFKWVSIRSLRPFTTDEIGAFVSWIFLGHIVWIVIGTTTFVSLAIWAVNTVFAQETLAGFVGNYLTKSSGIKVVFESAIVPTWRSGVITFNNVFVSRRPGQQTKKERAVQKGSTSTAAAAAAEAAMWDQRSDAGDPDDDGNYSQFDVAIDTVNVTLSFSKWFNGKGLLRDVEIVGVRGVIDRTHVRKSEGYIDPRTYLHEHNTGDFEIDHFTMADVLLTVHQPDNFRPFTVSVFNCDLPRLRKQWLFYDFMSANNMSGSFDDSLFTVHPRQIHGTTGASLTDGVEDAELHQWKKHSRLRIDGLKIDHLNRGVEGPFAWIREGNVDIVADVMIPNDSDSIWRQSWRKSTEAMSDFYDRVEATVSSAQAHGKIPQPDAVIQHASESIDTHKQERSDEADKRFVVMDVKVHLNDVRAYVPLFTRDLTYVKNALVRPIVAYINSRRAFIPVNCRVVKRQSEFDGSWTIFDSGLLNDLSREMYDAFVRDIEDVDARKRRIKKVGWWTIQLAAQALFVGLAGQLA